MGILVYCGFRARPFYISFLVQSASAVYAAKNEFPAWHFQICEGTCSHLLALKLGGLRVGSRVARSRRQAWELKLMEGVASIRHIRMWYRLIDILVLGIGAGGPHMISPCGIML